MSRLGGIAYHALALLAMLAHLVVVGLLGLVVLSLVPAEGTEIPALALKTLIALVWGGLGLIGLNAWRQRSWVVVAVPVVSFCLVALGKGIGDAAVHWTLGIGY
jgi:hypothetical protein